MNVQILSGIIATQTVEFCQELTMLANRNVEVLSTIENPSQEVLNTISTLNEVLSLCANRISTYDAAFLSEVINSQSIEFVTEFLTSLSKTVATLSTIENPSSEIMTVLGWNEQIASVCVTRIASLTETPVVNTVVALLPLEVATTVSSFVNSTIETIANISDSSNEVLKTLSWDREIASILESRIATASATATASAHASTTETEMA